MGAWGRRCGEHRHCRLAVGLAIGAAAVESAAGLFDKGGREVAGNDWASVTGFADAGNYTHFDIYGWNPSAAPARTKGGTGMGARAILEALPKILPL